MSRRQLIVMCNGPSLGGVCLDLLRGRDTFGLNAAYRAYPRIKFWPTHFGCFDYIVTRSHRDAYWELMNESPIGNYFWLDPALAHEYSNVVTLDRTPEPQALGNSLQAMPDIGNSGANACQVGYIMGYTEIVLVGADCRYVEVVDGAVNMQGHLVMERTPDANPNYWFSDYQQEGDHYNIPRAGRFQLAGWERLARLAERAGLSVINCSEGTALTCFETANLEDVLL